MFCLDIFVGFAFGLAFIGCLFVDSCVYLV